MTLMKSVLVRRPANVDVLESHNGADTIPIPYGQSRAVSPRGVDIAPVVCILFCIKIFTQVRRRRSLSSMMSRKDSGKTS